ncbi:MAG: SpoIID/LytB domain-containing protein [Polyangiaceae bacterium]|nr:SpoIID/LytB domain-containing protein [Polyangiaceae bacterium]
MRRASCGALRAARFVRRAVHGGGLAAGVGDGPPGPGEPSTDAALAGAPPIEDNRRMRWLGRLVLPAGGALALAACGSAEDTSPIGRSAAPVAAPLPEAYCDIVVEGRGTLAAEDDYLPHVITCENGGAGLEALKAQAIAARSVAYYAMAEDGSICDGQGCQVYTCAATPGALAYQAVAETRGQYLAYGGMLTYGFYVAGDPGVAPPSCVGSSGATEHWVTYNEGKSGALVEQTALGYVGPPGFGQNRGCMSQWGARCLESGRSYGHLDILRFFYGEDVQVLRAGGSCTGTGGAGGAGGGGVAGSGAVGGGGSGAGGAGAGGAGAGGAGAGGVGAGGVGAGGVGTGGVGTGGVGGTGTGSGGAGGDGTGAVAAGGGAASGGVAGSSGATAGPGARASEDAGCSCRAGARPPAGGWAAFGAALGLAPLRRPRARRRARGHGPG